MNAKQLRQHAKDLLHETLKSPNKHIDDFVDAVIDAVVAEIRENNMVDVPNTGYFGIIIPKGKP